MLGGDHTPQGKAHLLLGLRRGLLRLLGVGRQLRVLLRLLRWLLHRLGGDEVAVLQLGGHAGGHAGCGGVDRQAGHWRQHGLRCLGQLGVLEIPAQKECLETA